MFNVGIYKIFGLGLTLLFTIFMTRYFDSDVSGRYFQFVAFVSLMSTAVGATLQNFVLKKVSYLHEEGKSIDSIIWLSVLIMSFSFFLIFIILCFIYLINDLFILGDMIISLASVMFTVVFLTGIGFLRGIGDINSSQVAENIIKPLLLFLFALLMFYEIINSYRLIYFASITFCTAFVVFMLFDKVSFPKSIEIDSFFLDAISNVKDIFDMLILSTISAFQKNLDVIIIGFLLSNSDVSYYKLPVVFSTLITLGVLISNYYYSRGISIAYHKGTHDELQSLVSKGSRLSFYLGLIIFGVLIFSSPVVFIYSYSSEWIFAYKLFLVLSLGKLADSYFGSITTFANMTGNSKLVSLSMLLSLSMMFVLSLLLYQVCGLLGIAISVSFSFFLWNLLASCMLKYKTHIKFGVF
ncbi:MAG: hypothetical protein R3Y10_10285 [Ferrimonas sp.]